MYIKIMKGLITTKMQGTLANPRNLVLYMLASSANEFGKSSSKLEVPPRLSFSTEEKKGLLDFEGELAKGKTKAYL